MGVHQHCRPPPGVTVAYELELDMPASALLTAVPSLFCEMGVLPCASPRFPAPFLDVRRQHSLKTASASGHYAGLYEPLHLEPHKADRHWMYDSLRTSPRKMVSSSEPISERLGRAHQLVSTRQPVTHAACRPQQTQLLPGRILRPWDNAGLRPVSLIREPHGNGSSAHDMTPSIKWP